GIVIFSLAVLFYLVTLPVELDASRRALKILKNDGLLAGDELAGARSVLSAAAMTYVAAALSAILPLLRLISMAHRRD
ncbi:MAG: zinc metallopeptidase, partial [Lachnospiraceae bacterium]|nr:zinc metallopeptidase [Lachnospiraceae bacterium]